MRKSSRLVLCVIVSLMLLAGLALVHFSLLRAAPSQAPPIVHTFGATHTLTPGPTPTPGLTLTPGPTATPQVPPHIFIGTVTNDGVLAPVGIEVTASNGGIVGSTEVGNDGAYTLVVNQGTGTDIIFNIDVFIANETATWEEGGVTVLDLTTNPCSPLSSGDWVVGQSCDLVGSKAAAANVIVEKNVALTITENASLAIDFPNHHLRIKDGAKVIVRGNGKVGTLSGWIFQSLSAPTDDPRVRQAIDLTVNEAQIGVDFFFLPNFPSLVGAVQTHDPDRAKELLAEAGFPEGFPGLCIGATGSTAIGKANAMAISLADVGIVATVNGASCNTGKLFVF